MESSNLSSSITGVKRTACEELSTRPTKHPKSTYDSTINDDENPLGLFELPAELRNMIYEKVAEDQVAELYKGKLTDISGLLETDPKIRDEYYPFLLSHSSTLEANIEHFDFSEVGTFLNSLTESEACFLPSLASPTERKFTICMAVSTPCAIGAVEMLQQWLNNCNDSTKRESSLDVEYVRILPQIVQKYPSAWDAFNNPVRVSLSLWTPILKKYIEDDPESRGAEEAKKIWDALR